MAEKKGFKKAFKGFQRRHGFAAAILNIVIIFSVLAAIGFVAKSFTSTSIHVYYDVSSVFDTNSTVAVDGAENTVSVSIPSVTDGNQQFIGTTLKGYQGSMNYTLINGVNDTFSQDMWGDEDYSEWTVGATAATFAYKQESGVSYLAISGTTFWGGNGLRLLLNTDFVMSSESRIEIKWRRDSNITNNYGLMMGLIGTTLSDPSANGNTGIQAGGATWDTDTINPAAAFDGKKLTNFMFYGQNSTVGTTEIDIAYLKLVNISVSEYVGRASPLTRFGVDGKIAMEKRQVTVEYLDGVIYDDVVYNYTIAGTLHIYDVDELPEISSGVSSLKGIYTFTAVPSWIDSATLLNITLICRQAPVDDSLRMNGEETSAAFGEVIAGSEYTITGISPEAPFGETTCRVEINFDATFASGTVWIAIIGSMADWANYHETWALVITFCVIGFMLFLFYRRSELGVKHAAALAGKRAGKRAARQSRPRRRFSVRRRSSTQHHHKAPKRQRSTRRSFGRRRRSNY